MGTIIVAENELITFSYWVKLFSPSGVSKVIFLH